MLRSLYSAVSGLQQHQKAMDVLGNNVSNVNTVGYKASRLTFKDLISQTVSIGKAPTGNIGGINPLQVGLGTNIASVDNIFLQGTFQNTGVTTDLAIDGRGFFVLQGENEGERYFTRAGNFSFDREGYLVNPQGFRVQGWMTNLKTNELNTELENIRLSVDYKTFAPKETTEAKIAGNLSTVATPSKLEFLSLTAIPKPTKYSINGDDKIKIENLMGKNGQKMDIQNGEKVKIKAHATNVTRLNTLYNNYDQYMNVAAGDKIVINIDGNQYEYNITENSTVGNILNFVNSNLPAGAVFSYSDGKFQLKSNTATFTIDFSSTNNYLNTIFNQLDDKYTPNKTNTTNEIYYIKELVYGTDFDTIQRFVSEIQDSIRTNVSNGFTAVYDEERGKVVYSNVTVSAGSSFNITAFTIDKAYSGSVFETSFDLFDTLTVSPASASTTIPSSDGPDFLRYASGYDTIAELYDMTGNDLGVSSANGTVEFSGVINGQPISNVSPIVNGTDTLESMLIKLENFLMGSRDPKDNALDGFVKLENGKIIVQSEKGKNNNIDLLKLTSKNGPTDNVTFEKYLQPRYLEKATGGELITSQTIYDKQGNSHVVNYKFELYDEKKNLWKMTISVSNPGESVFIDQGTKNPDGSYSVMIQFNDNGSLNAIYNFEDYPKTPISDLKFVINTTNGTATTAPIRLFLGDPNTFNGMTLSSDPSTITYSEQDGYTRGDLDRININDVGEIIGSYDNGQIKKLGQIAIAIFTNQEGLARVGGSLFAETPNSGLAAIGIAGQGGRGIVQSGVVENSNVDIAQEFVTMITVQRGYQTNSRVITTSDEMLQELLNLKR